MWLAVQMDSDPEATLKTTRAEQQHRCKNKSLGNRNTGSEGWHSYRERATEQGQARQHDPLPADRAGDKHRDAVTDNEKAGRRHSDDVQLALR